MTIKKLIEVEITLGINETVTLFLNSTCFQEAIAPFHCNSLLFFTQSLIRVLAIFQITLSSVPVAMFAMLVFTANFFPRCANFRFLRPFKGNGEYFLTPGK